MRLRRGRVKHRRSWWRQKLNEFGLIMPFQARNTVRDGMHWKHPNVPRCGSSFCFRTVRGNPLRPSFLIVRVIVLLLCRRRDPCTHRNHLYTCLTSPDCIAVVQGKYFGALLGAKSSVRSTLSDVGARKSFLNDWKTCVGTTLDRHLVVLHYLKATAGRTQRNSWTFI